MTMMSVRVRLALALLVAVLPLAASSLKAQATTWQVGDVFVGVGFDYGDPSTLGHYARFSAEGVQQEMIDTRTPSWTTGCAIDRSTGNLWTTSFDWGVLTTLDPTIQPDGSHTVLGTKDFYYDFFLRPLDAQIIESIVFDTQGNYYIGVPEETEDYIWDTEAPSPNLDPLYPGTYLNGEYAPDYTKPLDGHGDPQLTWIPWWTGRVLDGYGTILKLSKTDAFAPTRIRVPVDTGYDPILYPMPPNPADPAEQSDHPRGADWLDLASDGHTMFYTSEDRFIRTWNLDTNSPGPSNPGLTAVPEVPGVWGKIGEEDLKAFAFRLLPPGDGSGGAIVAASAFVYRLDSHGQIIAKMAAPTGSGYFSLNISPDGQYAWSVSGANHHLNKFYIPTGQMVLSQPVGIGAMTLGVCVKEEYTAAEHACPVGSTDPLCTRIEACTPYSPGDDDGDGLPDVADPDCLPIPHPAESCGTGTAGAGLGTDDDRNGLVDETCGRLDPENAGISLLFEGPVAPGETRTYSATGLPPGLTMNVSTGLVSGTIDYSAATPLTSPQAYTVTVAVDRQTSTGVSLHAEGVFVWSVENRNAPPALTLSTSTPTVAEGSTLTAPDFTISATDFDGDPLTYGASGLPAGATFDTSTGAFSWAPDYTQAGTYTVTFSVSDGVATDTEVATITVTNSNRAPVLTLSTSAPTVAEGATLTAPAFTVTGTDADSDPLTYSVTDLPVGATFNTSTGAFSWTPTYSQAGSYPVSFSVSDGTAADSKSATITVTNVNRAPVLTLSTSTPTVGEGATLTAPAFTVTATDADSDPLTYSATGLPAGATFDTSTGAFSWTPGYTQAGSYLVTFSVTDGTDSDTESATITVTNVNRAPVLTLSTSTPVIAEGSTLTAPAFTVTATDADGDPLTYSATGLPAGTTFDTSTGAFSWTPTYNQASSYPVSFTVSDGTATDTKSATITVTNTNRLPVLTLSTATPTVAEGATLAAPAFTVTATDVDGDPLTFSATGLPAGATFNTSTGAFSWTPAFTQAGSYAVIFSVSDGTDGDSETATITVTNVNHPPVLALSTSTPTVAEGSTLTGPGFTVTATDADTDDSLTYSATGLPAGASFNASTGAFSWTPGYTEAGSYPVTFSVSDGTASDTKSATIVVTDVTNLPPNCSAAVATPFVIWPPNHKMVPISIRGVTDDSGVPAITITGIFQDEPVNSGADGDTGPDGAGIGTETALVRAERAGSESKKRGNGRVYHIYFTATDGVATCSSEVKATVPHDRSGKVPAVDGGALFDSTVVPPAEESHSPDGDDRAKSKKGGDKVDKKRDS